MMYRERFGNDIVIDLVGYRRYGHNGGRARLLAAVDVRDDRAPSVRELYQAVLVEAGTIGADDADAMVKAAQRDLATRQASVRKGAEEPQGVIVGRTRSRRRSRPSPGPRCRSTT